MALREILADLRVRVRGTEQLQRANTGISTAVSGLRNAGAALTGAAAAVSGALAVGQISDFVSETVSMGDEVAKTARRLGIGVEALQQWQFAAERSGVDSGALTNALQRLQRNAFDATLGLSTAVESFGALGVSVRDSGGNLREAEDLMLDVVSGLAQMDSRTEQTALAMRVFGRAGAQLLPLLDEGEAGIAELMERARELGVGFSEDAALGAEAAADAISDYDLAMRGLRGQLAAAFLPTLSRVVRQIADWTASFGRVLQNSNALQVGLGFLTVAAGALALALAPLAAIVLTVAAPFAALFLVVEDLVTLFSGGESAIGGFIDALFGVGSAQETVEDLTAAWEALTHAIRDAWAALTGQNTPARLSAGDALSAQQLEAARQGRIVGRRGQTREQALAETNRARAELGLSPLGQGPTAQRPHGRTVDVAAVRAAVTPRPTVPSVGRSSGASETTIHDQRRVDLTLRVEGARDPQAVASAVRRQLGEELQRHLGRAAATLPVAAEAAT